MKNDALFEELEKASKPLVEFLQKNYHPHAIAIIKNDSIEIYLGTLGIPIKPKEEI